MSKCSLHPFGKNMHVIIPYDGIFFLALDTNTNILYSSESGGDEDYIYWSLDFSQQPELLRSVLCGEVDLHDVVANGIIPSKLVRVVDFEYGQNWAEYLEDVSNFYLPNMISKGFHEFLKKYYPSAGMGVQKWATSLLLTWLIQ